MLLPRAGPDTIVTIRLLLCTLFSCQNPEITIHVTSWLNGSWESCNRTTSHRDIPNLGYQHADTGPFLFRSASVLNHIRGLLASRPNHQEQQILDRKKSVSRNPSPSSGRESFHCISSKSSCFHGSTSPLTGSVRLSMSTSFRRSAVIQRKP